LVAMYILRVVRQAPQAQFLQSQSRGDTGKTAPVALVLQLLEYTLQPT